MKRQLFMIKQSTKLFGVVALSAAIAVGCSASPAASPSSNNCCSRARGQGSQNGQNCQAKDW